MRVIESLENCQLVFVLCTVSHLANATDKTRLLVVSCAIAAVLAAAG